MIQLFRSAVYRYFINLDERGEFYADVRNIRDRYIFEITVSKFRKAYRHGLPGKQLRRAA